MDKKFSSHLQNCTACPVACHADRTKKVGACGVQGLQIAKFGLHPFEEPCISFQKGSGTIFFSGCNLRCVFCQNYDLSRANRGKKITVSELVEIFKTLESQGAENVSLVTPSHLIPYLCEALAIYKPSIPVVYNSSGYDDLSSLRQIDPFIDVYLPDLKFYSPSLSMRYTGKADYFDIASQAVQFMANKRTVLTDEGKMLSGLCVRHLVMPLGVADSKKILSWIANNLPKTTHVSVMSQYTPLGDVANFPELNRPVTKREYDAVVDYALSLGLENLFTQNRTSADSSYVPSWDF